MTLNFQREVRAAHVTQSFKTSRWSSKSGDDLSGAQVCPPKGAMVFPVAHVYMSKKINLVMTEAV